MMTIPNIIDPSVPIGKDDSCNVEIEKFGEPVVPDFEIPYHTEIMERFNGIDLDAAGKVAGNGFYYLMGDIARVHSGFSLKNFRSIMSFPPKFFCSIRTGTKKPFAPVSNVPAISDRAPLAHGTKGSASALPPILPQACSCDLSNVC